MLFECGHSLRKDGLDGPREFDIAALLTAAPAWGVTPETVRVLASYAQAGLADAQEMKNG